MSSDDVGNAGCHERYGSCRRSPHEGHGHGSFHDEGNCQNAERKPTNGRNGAKDDAKHVTRRYVEEQPTSSGANGQYVRGREKGRPRRIQESPKYVVKSNGENLSKL